METLGKKISSHRKRLNLTQTELGEQLNVTAQAVSKWETGMSDPDLSTLQRLSKIFGVSIDELIGDGTEQAEEPLDAQEETVIAGAEAAEQEPPAPPRAIVAYCERCKKPLYAGDEYDVTNHRGGRQTILCPECLAEKKREDKRLRAADEERAFRRSMIWSPVAAAGTALLFLIIALAAGDYSLLWAMLLGVGAFTFVAQCFWQEWIFDFLCFFFRSFRMPGVIFTLDIDGIVWAILVKFFLGILGGLLSVIIAFFGILLSFVVSIFTFPFALPAELRKIAKLKKEASK